MVSDIPAGDGKTANLFYSVSSTMGVASTVSTSDLSFITVLRVNREEDNLARVLTGVKGFFQGTRKSIWEEANQK